MSTSGGSRRRPVELRALLVAAAHELFTERGYAGTTTKDLAQRAGVAESVLFNQFGSKDELFREVMLTPFVSFLEGFAQRSRRYFNEPLPMETSVRLFVAELFELLHEHRLALRSLLAAEANMQPGALATLHESVDALLASLTEAITEEADRRRLIPSASNWDTVLRTSFGALLAAAILDDWLMPAAAARPREQVIDDLAQIITHGFARTEP